MDAPPLQIAPPRCGLAPLRTVVAAGLLLALVLLPTSSGAVEPSTDHDVVIVGAGAAGLYAAYTLSPYAVGARRDRVASLYSLERVEAVQTSWLD